MPIASAANCHFLRSLAGARAGACALTPFPVATVLVLAADLRDMLRVVERMVNRCRATVA